MGFLVQSVAFSFVLLLSTLLDALCLVYSYTLIFLLYIH